MGHSKQKKEGWEVWRNSILRDVGVEATSVTTKWRRDLGRSSIDQNKYKQLPRFNVYGQVVCRGCYVRSKSSPRTM